MEYKFIYPVLRTSLFKSNLSSKLLRLLFTPKHTCYHNKSWEIESDDEGDFSRPVYGNRKESWNFKKSKSEPHSHYSNRRNSYNKRDDYFDRNTSPEWSGGRNHNFNRSHNTRFSKNFDVGENLSKPNWNEIELQPFVKDCYTPSENVLNRSTEEIENFRKTHNLTMLGKDVPNPILEFSDHNFPEEISKIFSEKDFQAPTPIQAQGWPIALSGRDMIGIGQTGSGKTLGYIVPGLMHITNQPKLGHDEGPIGLVMAPTRELVQQIHEVSQEVFKATNIRTSCLFGGASKNVQANSLYKKPSLCIATPGRLLDFLEMGVTNLKRCSYLVLDEADRMLDMGFEPQIRKIVNQIRPDRQTLMWSATWPKEVEELGMDFLNNFIRLNVGSLELVANPDIEQIIEVCDSFEKLDRFIKKLKGETEEIKSKILVFTQTKTQVDFLSRKLYNEGIRARGIHGDHSQASRNHTLQGFRMGRYSVLVATDVASRGLDVDDISLVVNYDFPNSIEDYIHRIGRTGRAGKAGRAFSLLTENDAQMAKELIRVLKEAQQNVPESLHELLERNFQTRNLKKRYNKGFNRYKPRSNYY